MADRIKSNQVVESSDAEVFLHNGISPLTSEIRMSRQVVVVQEPSLVLKLKGHQIHNLYQELKSDRFYDNSEKPYTQLLLVALEQFIENPPKMDGVEAETIFDD